MNIDGNTRVIVHLAYPSKHLRTPSFFNPLLERQGRNAILVPWQVRPDVLTTVWEGLRQSESLAGVIVTIPHKTAVAHLCDELENEAAFLKVANVARREADGRFIGRMFDGPGYLNGLRHEGHEVKGKRVLILGAGGAATGISHSLVENDVSQLTIANRTTAKAEELASKLNTEFGRTIAQAGEANGEGSDIVINATSVGLKADDPLPIDPATFEPHALIAEVIMEPDMTPLLEAAQAQGNPIHKGKHMITGQIELLADYLLGPIERA